MVETGIAVSVIILGASVAFRIKTPTAAATGVVGLFALFHGHAHGAEMPGSVSGLTYAIGFLAATASLHLVGIGTGLLFSQLDQRRGAIITQVAGSVAALAGVGLVLGIL
jgi:urease accessory protein